MRAVTAMLPHRAPRSSSLRHSAPAFVGGVALGAAVALALAIGLPLIVGWKPMTVLTGSMRPAIQPGDVVIDEMIAPASALPGDIVTFHDPARNGELVTHRVRSARRVGRRIDFVTRGDANTASERWSVPADGQIGRVAFRVPYLGYARRWLHGPLGLLLIVLPAVALALLELRAIWRRPAAPAR